MKLRILGLVVLVGLLSSPAFATSVSPGTATVTAGETFFLDITAFGVTDLFAYQFAVTFPSALLSANSIEDGDFFAPGDAFGPGDIHNAAGAIDLTGNALTGAVPGLTGNVVLGRISFTALADGIATISLSDVLLLDSSIINEISADVAPGSVTVNPAAPPSAQVPEPSTVVLLGGGLVAAVRRRRAHRAA